MPKFKAEDFTEPVPQPFIDCLNKLDEETDAIANRAAFCREHNFLREAEYLDGKVSVRSRVVVSICNSLGKYF